MNDRIELVLVYALMAPPLLLSLTLHEYAHARVAYAFGDPTAKSMGRLTLNPLKHLDLFGTIMLFIAKFGWAKPVPVNPHYFRNPRMGMLWVALAGPATNFTIALCAALTMRLLSIPDEPGILALILQYTLIVNTYLAILNLLPVPPLDGSRILAGLLPDYLAEKVESLERYGLFLMAGLFLYISVVDPTLLRRLTHPFTLFFRMIAGG